MADTTPVASSEASTPPSSAAEQARIRKERRDAKIRAGVSARLNKITGLGGVQRGMYIFPGFLYTSFYLNLTLLILPQRNMHKLDYPFNLK
jgi:hypothetical protein